MMECFFVLYALIQSTATLFIALGIAWRLADAERNWNRKGPS